MSRSDDRSTGDVASPSSVFPGTGETGQAVSAGGLDGVLDGHVLTIEGTLADLDRVFRSMDEMIERSDSRGTRGCIVSVLSAVLLAIPILIALGNEDWSRVTLYCGLLCLLSVAPAIYAIVMWSRELPKGERLFVRELLEVLSADLKPGKPFSLRFVLTPFDEGEAQWNGHLCTNSLDWLDVKAPMADGNLLRLSVRTVLQRKAKFKKSSTRYRFKRRVDDVSLLLTINPDRYLGVAAVEEMAGTSIGGGMVIRSARMDGRRLRLKARAVALHSSGGLQAAGLLSLVSFCYGRLVPLDPKKVKKTVKKKRAAGTRSPGPVEV